MKRTLISGFLSIGLLVSCGGGGGDTATAPNVAPSPSVPTPTALDTTGLAQVMTVVRATIAAAYVTRPLAEEFGDVGASKSCESSGTVKFLADGYKELAACASAVAPLVQSTGIGAQGRELAISGGFQVAGDILGADLEYAFTRGTISGSVASDLGTNVYVLKGNINSGSVIVGSRSLYSYDNFTIDGIKSGVGDLASMTVSVNGGFNTAAQQRLVVIGKSPVTWSALMGPVSGQIEVSSTGPSGTIGTSITRYTFSQNGTIDAAGIARSASGSIVWSSAAMQTALTEAQQ